MQFDTSHLSLDEAKHIIDSLTPFAWPQRLARFHQVLMQRRQDITCLLCRFFDPHNNAAVIRSAEGLGLPAVHLIPGKQGAAINQGVSMHADQWMTIYQHDDENQAAMALKNAGYLLIGADIAGEPLETLTLPHTSKVCLVMGSEKQGLTPAIKPHCSQFIRIPMQGMVESFNVSVAAALLLQSLLSKLDKIPLDALTYQQQLAGFLLQSVEQSEAILRRQNIKL